MAIDEAAAIPLPLVRAMLGPYLVFLSSTVNGYEGTGGDDFDALKMRVFFPRSRTFGGLTTDVLFPLLVVTALHTTVGNFLVVTFLI